MKGGQRDEAARMLDAAIVRFAGLGDVKQCEQATRQLAELRMDAGDWDDAHRLIERSLAFAADLPELELGRDGMMHEPILRRLARLAKARIVCERALGLFRDADARIEEAGVLNSLGVLARDDGRVEDAERIHSLIADIRANEDLGGG